MAKKAAKKKAADKKTKDMLVVGSKVKALIKSKGCMTSGEVLPALNDKLYELLDAAVARTKSNKRSTVRPQDL